MSLWGRLRRNHSKKGVRYFASTEKRDCALSAGMTVHGDTPQQRGQAHSKSTTTMPFAATELRKKKSGSPLGGFVDGEKSVAIRVRGLALHFLHNARLSKHKTHPHTHTHTHKRAAWADQR
nr:hypothetical protein [Pandoravirus massiliensis]